MLQPLQAPSTLRSTVQTVDTAHRRQPLATLSYMPSQTHAKPAGNRFCNLYGQSELVRIRSMPCSSATGPNGKVGLV